MCNKENGKTSSVVQIIDSTEDNIEKSSYPSWMFWKRRRYLIAMLALLGFFNAYAMRINLSIAIVAMTELKNVTLINGTTVMAREFNWDLKMQGYVLSSFFYGYITTQLIGGYVATRVGGKHIFGLGIAVTAVFTLLTPWVASVSVYLLLVVRIIEGIFEGVTYPCLHAIWSQWAPPLERSRLFTVAHSGSYIGTVISMPLSSYLAVTFGWSSIFYFFGILGLIWYASWMFIVANSPEEDKKITSEELAYIKKSMENENSDPNKVIPWKAFLTSVPIWAIVAAHFTENWGFYTLLTELPTFMKNVLKLDLTETGYSSALPYLVMSIMLQFTGPFADWCQMKGILSTTQVRKIFTSAAFVCQTIFLLLAVFLLSAISTTICIAIAVGVAAFAWAGFSVNHLDIAPQYAGVLMGFTNTFGTLPGIISPILTGYIVAEEASASQWRIVFFVASGIYLFGAVVYGIFASGQLQPWAIETKVSKDNQEQKEQTNQTNL